MAMTLREALLTLYALQQWACLPNGRDGSPYGPSWFIHQAQGFVNGINVESRRVQLQLIDARRCFVCKQLIDITNSDGDHLIPIVHGGRNSLTNYVPICKGHNSSKGKKDLLEWWLFKGWPPQNLDRAVVCIYARLHWQLLVPEQLDVPAPPATQQFVAQLTATLPSPHHRNTLCEIVSQLSEETALPWP